MAGLQPPTRSRTKNWMIAVIVAFLLGLLPMWGLAYMRGSEANQVKVALRTATLKNQVAEAALYCKRGEYEKSRQAASEFFGGLGAHLNSTGVVSNEDREKLSKLAAQQDQVITLLSRSDPAAVERLFELQYLVMQALPN